MSARRLWPPRVRTLLAAVLLVVLAVPILSIGAGRVYEDLLVRHTEEVLIAEAVVIGEAYRRLLDPEGASRPLPPLEDPSAEPYHPFLPQLDLHSSPILPPAQRADEAALKTRTSSAGSAQALSAMLERSLIRNLTGVRVIDREGRVIASPAREVGYRLGHLEEVQAALRGEYGAAIRERVSKDSQPPLESIRRATRIRVSIAVPVYADPRAKVGPNPDVLGVVYNSRTPIDVEKSIWLMSDELAVPALLSVLITLAIVALLATAIARPLTRLERAAERVAGGEPGVSLEVKGFAPEEVRALAEALSTMRRELETRASYIKEFAANAAHELKTPLTSLRGAAELLREDGASMPPEQARRFLSNIHDDAVRMDHLVQRLLHLARIEASAPARERLDLAAFLEAIVERYARRGVPVACSYRAPSRATHMAPDQLESLVTNLLDNAARHGAGAPIELVVEPDGDGSGGHGRLRLTVRDRGPAMSPEHFSRLFQRFYTTERERGGTGLGLSMVRAIAEAHGGRAWAERHDDGASFHVTLPGGTSPVKPSPGSSAS